MVSLGVGWEDFLPWQLVGFFFLVMGTLVYNEIIVIPVGFMMNMTKREIKKREKETGKLDESTGDYLDGKNPAYIATSPTGYGG